TRDMLFEEMTSELNIIPFTRILSPEAYDEAKAIYENLPIKIGDKKEIVLKCIKVLLKQFGAEAPEGSVWYSNAIPLAGLVKLLLVEDEYRTMILLSDYGQDGAKSCITETPIRLDFTATDKPR
ncbi:MAG: hypothetical protein QME51_10165, partial [Planctomycetota bacterium]|nr:hypothetical protein [Planctomycetota bacterium]